MTSRARRPILLTIALTLALGTSVVARQDPSPHQVRFVTVEPGVQLELLDWGGAGPSVMLLAGSGNTGHSFDDFAVKLRDCCHVYAITRRGYGQSSRPASGYGWQRLADDVWQVIDRERIRAPVLIGHSMAGGEMTAVGHDHSDRLSGIIYLDALGDLEDDPPADREWVAAQQALPRDILPAPQCPGVDRTSFAAYRRSSACGMGFTFPESELREVFDAAADGRVGPPKVPNWVSHDIGQGQIFRRDYTNIRVPVLAVSNGVRPEASADEFLAAFNYVPKNAAERAAVERFVAAGRVVIGRWGDKLRRGAPNARFVWYPNAGHFVHMTRETDVLREIHAFIQGLPAAK